MLRGMVFVDYLNFDISIQNLYGQSYPTRLNYNTVFSAITKYKPKIEVDFLKTFIFAPKPDEFLMQIPKWQNYYKWLYGLRGTWFMDVIEGRYLSHPTIYGQPKDPNNRDSFYLQEKGTDINLAVHLLSLAYNNSYDVAFVISGDTDYISVYRRLKDIGKLVIVVLIGNQSVDNLREETDSFVYLDQEFFDKHLRP